MISITTAPGVTSLTGTANQITASASTGAVTLSLPTTITGLSSVSSTTFVGALTGAASSNVLKAGDTMTGELSIITGSASVPGLRFSGDTDTGIYSVSSNVLGIATGGLTAITFDPTVSTIFAGTADLKYATLKIGSDTSSFSRTNSVSKFSRLVMPHYTTATPDYAFMFASCTSTNNTIQIGTGASSTTTTATVITVILNASNTATTGNVTAFQWVSTQARNQVGTTAIPSYSFIGDNDTGMYNSAANKLGFSCNGADVLTIDTTTSTFIGNVAVGTVGKGLQVKEGTNAKMGTATLVGGTVTVSTTAVTASSRIFLTISSLGTVTVPKAIGVTATTASTSFVITSADATDTSVINWIIFEPA